MIGPTTEVLLARWAFSGERAMLALASGLDKCTNLRVLKLSWNGLDNHAAEVLAPCLAKCTKLESLNLEGNFIQGYGIGLVLDSVRMCCHNIAELCLAENEFGNAGCAKTAAALDTLWPTMRVLDLSACSISDKGVFTLCPKLRRCKRLKALRLGHTHMTLKSLKALVQILPEVVSLEKLDLGGNFSHTDSYAGVFGNEGAALLGGVLGRCRSLRALNLSTSEISDLGAQHLAPGWRSARRCKSWCFTGTLF